MLLPETPRRQLITQLVGWGHWFALANIVIAIFIAGIYLFSSRFPDTALGTLYLLSNWLGHISFLTFFGFVILVLPLCYLVPNHKVVRGIGSVVAASALAFLALDALFYTRHGVHLGFSSADFVKDQTSSAIASFSLSQWSFMIVLFVAWLLFQLTLANAVWKRLKRLQKWQIGLPVTSFFVVCFSFSHAAHIWADAKLYQPIIQQDNMLPLSYPATAKTLMSRYGLLDIQDYRQKKELQLDRQISGIQYPTEPLYCQVNPQKLVILLQVASHPEEKLNLSGIESGVALKNHYDMSMSALSGMTTVLYGLPEIYHNSLQQHAPILLDMPQKLGLPVTLFSHDPATLPQQSRRFTSSWATFKSALAQDKPGLIVAAVTPEQMQKLSVPESAHWFVSQLNHNQEVETFHNLAISSDRLVSSQQDIAATMLAQLGCNALPNLHSTGQNLLAKPRNWLVTTQADKLLVMTPQSQIEVDSSGNYQTIDAQGNRLNDEALDTSVLSRAIKLLSQFAQ